jgi:nitrous oxidase accessory protein
MHENTKFEQGRGLLRRAPAGTSIFCILHSAFCIPALAAGFDLSAAVRDAQPGDTIHIPAGVYAAPLVIDRPIQLIAEGDVLLDGRGQGDLLRIEAPDVTVRGLRLRGSGDSLDRENAGIVVAAPRARIEQNRLEDVLVGILLRNADETVLRGNRIAGKPLDPGRRGDGIRLWNSHHCRIEANQVIGVRDVVIWYSRGTRIVGNQVTSGRYGLHFMYAHDSVLEDNRLSDNSVGVFLMYSRDIVLRRNVLAHNRGPSGYGLGLKDIDEVAVEENVFLANRVGIYLDNSPQRLDAAGRLHRNVFAFNDVGLAFLPSVKRNRFSENSFIENVEQVAILGGGELAGNDFAPDGRGNYWSDYAGFDADADGVGDVPYRAMSLFESLIDREPKLRLLLYSPVQQAIELAARALPVVRPGPKISDDAPRMKPIELDLELHRAGSAWPMGSLGAGLLGALGLAWSRCTRLARSSGRRSIQNEECRMQNAERAHTNAVGPHGADGALRSAAIPHSDFCILHSSPRPPGRAAAPLPVESAIISFRALRKAFGRNVAVDGLDLDIPPGQAVALWGENGAGKTTVIKCALGLWRYRGQIRVGGFDARRQGKAARRLVGYVSQELALYDDLSAFEAVRLFARLKCVPPQRAAEVLAQVGLEEHATKRVGALSGGMKQRLSLAIALLACPPVLLLDEPTSNLDAPARRAFLDLLAGLKNAGKTILFTTHRADEVVLLADRLVILERGRVKFDGDPAGLGGRAEAQVTLRIPLADGVRDAAARTLERAGLAVSHNHSALLVRVAPTRKGVPLTLLVQSGFAIEDVDFET